MWRLFTGNNRIVVTFLLALCLTCLCGCDLGEALGADTEMEGVIILIYHHLVEGEARDDSEINVLDFALQMEYLADNNYQTLSLDELIYCHREGKFPPRGVLITFDDGYFSFYEHAYPILVRHNLRATIFPVVSFTPGLQRRINWSDHLTFHHLRYMSKESGLIDIGSHTFDLHFTWEDERPAIMRRKGEGDEHYLGRIRKDLLVSKELLELETDHQIISLAWPYGETTREAAKIAHELGYKLLFTTNPGLFTSGSSLASIPRNHVQTGSLEDFTQLLHTLGGG